MREDGDVLSWIQIGDLHLTAADQDNHRDLKRLVAALKGLPRDAVDFVVLPGDNADDGTPEQFALVRDAVAGLPAPLHILPGDHDIASGSLAAFHDVLGAARLPKAVSVRGHRCLFLDVVSAGSGGPDFRLAAGQLTWLEHAIAAAEAGGETVVVFMHTYPADLLEGADRLARLLAHPCVAAVGMGHTHYNELANDGRTIFMATRSTGQIEEGPVGLSVAAVDGSGVSWRFKPLDALFPLVLITRPIDRRLATENNGPTPSSPVRALVLADAPVDMVELRVAAGAWTKMHPDPRRPALWTADVAPLGTVTVRARDAQGRADEDRIEPPSPSWEPPVRARDGSDRDRIGAWPEKGLLDTQLGPNRNGRHW